MPDEQSFHMTPDEFRRYGHAVVDWIADYQSRIESFPVLSQVKPGKIRASLPANPPMHGEPFEALLNDVEKLILPGRHALAVAELLCLFSMQCLRPWNSRRPSLFRPGRARHALVDQSGVHRTGNARARLACKHAWIA